MAKKPSAENQLTLQNMLDELSQAHNTRKPLYSELERIFTVPVISFFTSFIYPATIHDKDADMIENVLQGTDVKKGFLMIINSPGGSALAAERIIQVCRAYSADKFSVVVPKMAKSAATMICLGASKIIMSRTSELGPIDPQVIITEGQTRKLFPAFLLIQSYRKLIEEAIRVKQPIEIFLQQLSKYDHRDIALYEQEADLAKDIAARALKSGILKSEPDQEVQKTISFFLEPTRTKVHGRPIYLDDLAPTKLNLERLEIDSEQWKLIWNLYVRLDCLLSRGNVAKIVESKDYSYIISVK